MAEPPKTPPSSDIEGVNRDARIQQPQPTAKPNAGKQLKDAKENAIGRPKSPADDQVKP